MSPRVGIGCAPFGNLFAEVGDDDARGAVDAAWERGVRFFDTAPLYGHGLSESRLGAALAGRPRDEFVVSTKVGRVLVPEDAPEAGPDPGPDPGSIFVGVPALRPAFDYSERGVEVSLAASATRLGVDRFDVVHVHDPDDHLDQVVAKTYPVLARLRDRGDIGAIGLGTNHAHVAAHVAEHVDLDVLLLAGRCTLLDRSGLDVMARCASRGTEVVAAGVFNSGVLADPRPGAHFHYAPVPADVLALAQRLDALCGEVDVPLAAAALQFPLRHESVTRVLPGVRDATEVHTALDLLDRAIPDALWDRLDAAVTTAD